MHRSLIAARSRSTVRRASAVSAIATRRRRPSSTTAAPFASSSRASPALFPRSSSAAARRSSPAWTTARRTPFAMVSTATEEATTASAEASENNPLLDQKGLPRFATIEPSNLTPAVTSLLSKLESDFSELESKLDPESSYDAVLPEIEKMQEPLGYAWGVAGHLNGVKNTDELRRAYEENQPSVVKAMTQFSQSRAVYDALKGIEASWGEKEEGGELSFEESQRRRAVQNSLLSMTLGGVGLDGAQKERFNEIRLRLAELSTTFSNHVLDATKAFSLTVTDPKDVDGVPASAKAMWAAAHAAHLTSEAAEKKGVERGEAEEVEDPHGAASEAPPQPNPEEGPWRITLDAPSYIAAMSHLPNRSMRETIYKASVTRASEIEDAGRDNVPLINEILTLKQEQSKLLGFDNYAQQSLARKMAPSVEAVRELSDLLLDKALPSALTELEEVTELARKNGGEEYAEDKVEKLMPWDTTYWSERLKETKFDLKEEELRPYFALPAVLEGLFGLLDRLFDVEVRPADGEAEIWNPDVRFFHIHSKEEGNKHIASFYLDPYSRPADKRGGAWMDVCIGKSDACARDVPVAYLTCNGSPPVGDTPSLMTFREVITLFHETGHGIQHMLTRANVGDVAGINGVEWDAVELPSQFMENWCYDKATVYGFAKHYETGEPLPEEMFDKLKEQQTFNAGMMMCRQLLFGMIDMELHSNFDPVKASTGEGESVFDVQRRVAEKYSPYNLPLDYDRFLCTFNHIFGGGYAAGYYSYKWAEVMSADAFGAFEDAGLDDEEAVRKVGKAFRDTVLSLGGGVAPMDVYKRFRGREPSPDALLRHNGLA